MDIFRESRADDIIGKYARDARPCPEDFYMHIHDKYEITYFISGKGEYSVEGTPYPVSAGLVIISRPLETHGLRVSSDAPYERCVINFNARALDQIDPQRRLLRAFEERPLGKGNLYSAEELGSGELEAAIGGLRLDGGSDYQDRLEIFSRLYLTLLLIDGAYSRRGHTEYPISENLGERIVAYVNEHLFERLSVGGVADRFFLSRSQFSRIFKSATGATPWEYVTLKRLNAAKDMIKEGEAATSVCERCGFGDYSAFYRAYTKYFGVPPKHDGRKQRTK